MLRWADKWSAEPWLVWPGWVLAVAGIVGIVAGLVVEAWDAWLARPPATPPETFSPEERAARSRELDEGYARLREQLARLREQRDQQ